MASYPTYDLNEWVGGISQANFDAIEASGPRTTTPSRACTPRGRPSSWSPPPPRSRPGSSAPASTSIDTGTFTVPGLHRGVRLQRRRGRSNGRVNLPLALTESDDYYFYNLGYLFWQTGPSYRPDAIQNVADQYGLDSYTHIDLPDRDVGPRRQPVGRRRSSTPGPQGLPQRNTGRRATTSRWRSVRAARAHPDRRWPSPTPPSPTAAPVTSPRWRRPWSPPTARVVKTFRPQGDWAR